MGKIPKLCTREPKTEFLALFGQKLPTATEKNLIVAKKNVVSNVFRAQ